MRLVAPGHDERRDVELHEGLRLGTRGGIAIEERAAHALDQVAVSAQVVSCVIRGERGVGAYRRCPRSAARIGVERLAFLAHMSDHAVEAGAARESEMLREALVRLHAVLRAADRPPQEHAHRRLRMRHRECHHARAAHAAAHHVRALDAQVLEQELSVPRVMRPGDELDASRRLAALAPVEHDAAEFLRQVLEQLDARVDALRGPFLDRRVEAARRVHQDRRPVAQHLIARAQSVDQRFSHAGP